jgi:signal transduction histidine kinase
LELRPTALLDSKLDDLLRQLAEALAGRADLAVTLDVKPVSTLPPEVHVTFYRIAQEALQNIAKHAEAEHVAVRLEALPPLAPARVSGDWRGPVRLQVSDDGRGFDPASHGAGRLGLRIMRERAESIGANLIIDAGPGQGTQVTLSWQNG